MNPNYATVIILSLALYAMAKLAGTDVITLLHHAARSLGLGV